MLSRDDARTPAISLPLPLDGVATQAAWLFDEVTQQLEEGYQAARASFAADLERDTLEDELETSAQLTFDHVPRNRRGPKSKSERPLPTIDELLATLPRNGARRGVCRWRGRDMVGAPDLSDEQLARNVLYALRHAGREANERGNVGGGTEWDYAQIAEFTRARAATYEWFTAPAIMLGRSPQLPRALWRQVGRSHSLRQLLAFLVFADELRRWGVYMSGEEWSALLGCSKPWFYTMISRLESARWIVVLGTHRPRAHHEGAAPSETAINWIGVGPALARHRDLWTQRRLDLEAGAPAARAAAHANREAVRRHKYRLRPRRAPQFATRREFVGELRAAAERVRAWRDARVAAVDDAVQRRDFATILDDLRRNEEAAASVGVDPRLLSSSLLLLVLEHPIPDGFLDAPPEMYLRIDNEPAVQAGPAEVPYRVMNRRRRKEQLDADDAGDLDAGDDLDDLDASDDLDDLDDATSRPSSSTTSTTSTTRPSSSTTSTTSTTPSSSTTSTTRPSGSTPPATGQRQKPPSFGVLHAPTILRRVTDPARAGIEPPYPPGGHDLRNAGPSPRPPPEPDPRTEVRRDLRLVTDVRRPESYLETLPPAVRDFWRRSFG